MIYLDHHAAAPTCPEARAAMDEAALEAWANPSSVHSAGRAARARLDRARRGVAAAIGAEPADVVLTSGGTEAVNLGLHGLHRPGRGLVTTAVEHPAVLATADALAKRAGSPEPGRRIDVPRGVPPPPEAVAAEVEPGTLVAIQWVNHEVGTVFPISEYANAIRARGGLLFVDGTQALGKLRVDVGALGADAVAFASHKIGGPAGIGALWVRRGHELEPLLRGGGQERGRRPGSPDVVAAAGFGAACEAIPRRLAEMSEVAQRRDKLEAALKRIGATVQGDEAARVSTVCHAALRGWRGAVLAAALDLEGLCVTSGPACSSGVAGPSPGVEAMYPDELWRAEGIRLSLGPETSWREVDYAAIILENVARRAPWKGS